MFWSSMRRTEVSATPVMGPLVSCERMTSRNGARYSMGFTFCQSATRALGEGSRATVSAQTGAPLVGHISRGQNRGGAGRPRQGQCVVTHHEF